MSAVILEFITRSTTLERIPIAMETMSIPAKSCFKNGLHSDGSEGPQSPSAIDCPRGKPPENSKNDHDGEDRRVVRLTLSE